jgi:hypothetical protein
VYSFLLHNQLVFRVSLLLSKGFHGEVLRAWVRFLGLENALARGVEIWHKHRLRPVPVSLRRSGDRGMGRTLALLVLSAGLAGLTGCATGALLDDPKSVSFSPTVIGEDPASNEVYIPLRSDSEGYERVFETVLQVLISHGFDIAEQGSNRFDGRITTRPRTAPGLLQPLKPGSPDLYERTLATLQSYRHRATVKIEPANNGGFFVKVTVFRELEDLPRPVRATAGAASFRNEITVERQFQVIDPTVFESQWIPRGRDIGIEQAILSHLSRCL